MIDFLASQLFKAFHLPSLIVGGIVAVLVCGVTWYGSIFVMRHFKKAVLIGVIVIALALVKLAFL